MEPDSSRDEGHWLWTWLPPLNWWTFTGGLFLVGLVRQILWH